jgi:catechol 2,3-dioxygenase-like lactoylglutathione lyase family enzyme
MFSHMMVGSNDLERSKQFYDSVFGKEAKRDEKGRLSYGRRGAVFMVTSPIDGQAATNGNGSTIGFVFDSPEEVDAWHAAGVAAGGKAIEDPPGIRDGTFGALYLAYLRDPDGNKLCALHRMPAE